MNATTLETTTPINSQNLRVGALLQGLIQVLVGRVFWILGILAVAIAVAIVVSGPISKKTWQATTTIVFTQPSSLEPGREAPVSADLKTLVSLFKAKSIYEEALEACDLHVPSKALEANVTSTSTPGTRTMQISLNWEEQEEAENLLNELLEAYSRKLADVRKEKAKDQLSDLERNAKAIQSKLLAAQKELADFQTKNLVGDLQTDIARVTDDINSLEVLLRKIETTRASAKAQMNMIDQRLEKIRNQDAAEQEDLKKNQAAEDSVSDSRRRQDRLRELIADQRRVMDLKSQLDVKLKEQSRIRALFAKQAIAPAAVEEIDGQVRVLQAQLQGNKKIEELETEMVAIDKVVVPTNQKKTMGSPIIHQTLDKKLERELILVGCDQETKHIQEQMSERRARLFNLRELQQKCAALNSNITSLENQKSRMETLIGTLSHTSEIQAGDFTLVTPPSTGTHPFKTNRKILMGGIGMGVFLVGLLGLLAFEGFKTLRNGEAAAWAFGLPIAARIDPRDQNYLEGNHGFGALGLRQKTEEFGSIVLFTPHQSGCESKHAEHFLTHLAHDLSERDERVLLVDLQGAFANRPGKPLNAYWDYSADQDEVATPIGPGVDYVYCNKDKSSKNKWATRHMLELVKHWRSQYTMILIWGPGISETASVVQLGALTHARFVVVDSPKIPGAGEFKTISEMNRLGFGPDGQVLLT